MTKCSSCGAEILWVRTVSGKKMPLDVEPVWIRQQTGGHTYVREDGSFIFGEIMGDADDDPDANAIEAHTSHFATCPNADQHRKPRVGRNRRTR